MSLVDTLIAKAKRGPKWVALPECGAEKTLLAARRVLDEGVAWPLLVSPPALIAETAKRAGVSTEGMAIADTTDEKALEALAQRYMYYPRRRYTLEETREKLRDPVNYAMVLAATGHADTVFCGHVNTTKTVLLAAKRCIGLREGVDAASVFALAEIPGFSGPEGNVLALADCALNVDPNPEQLASIAISTCLSARALMGWEPRCAFLSFSTHGSGSGQSVDKIVRAVEIARERRPDLKIDGELQLDAALRPEVAAAKLPAPGEVAGRANVLIFPDLNAANIGIKMIQLFAGGFCCGHTLAGFALPVADSSRGATVEEIVGDIAMLVLDAQKEAKACPAPQS